MIIRGNQELMMRFEALSSEDIFIGNVISSHLKSILLIVLLERGIHCLPSPLSQILHRSKVAQALIFRDKMLPHTRIISRRFDLMDCANRYHTLDIGPVVTKENRKHCGHGVRKWDSIETLYNFISLSESSFPFVVQPFLENLIDIRVIIVGDRVHAYVRENPKHFRKNLSTGGKSVAFSLDKEKENFCRSVMARGKFPFAHIDLQITEKGDYFLGEIALNGGIKGSTLDKKDLDQEKQNLLEQMAQALQK